MTTVFEQEGSPARPEGNMPLRLTGDTRVWFVRSGPVDVFAVRVCNGQTTGPRIHLFRAEEGRFLFGVCPSRESDLLVLAVGRTGCEVSGLELERLKELTCEDPGIFSHVETALAAWVRGLSSGVQNGILPRGLVFLEPGEETPAGEGVNVATGSELVWVRQVEGKSLFCGQKGLSEIIPGDLFPLCPNASLESQSDARYLALETKPCLSEAPAGLRSTSFTNRY